jgi:hypothetical protein
MSGNILWTRHGTGESEWWSLGNYTCRKVNGKWVLKRSSKELGRFEYLQHALMAWFYQ